MHLLTLNATIAKSVPHFNTAREYAILSKVAAIVFIGSSFPVSLYLGGVQGETRTLKLYALNVAPLPIWAQGHYFFR